MKRIFASLLVLYFVTGGVIAQAEAPYDIAWSRQIGTTAGDVSYSVAVDAVGNAYITGYTWGSLAGPNAGANDAFLTKYDLAGNLLWSRQIGTISQDESFGVAVDAAGNAYISGWTRGSLGGPNAGSYDAFLTKYDGAGNHLWSRQIGTAAFDYSTGVAVDAAGNAFISGYTGDSLGGPNAGSDDAFLAKYDGAGNLIWSRQIGTSSRDVSNAVSVDAAGNAYISGHTHGSLARQNLDGADAFLTKYDGAGNLLWSHQLGTPPFDSSLGVAVDAVGNAYITGETWGSLGGPNAGFPDAFLAKYDGAGNLLWSRQIGTRDWDIGEGVAIDIAGNVYITGHTRGSLDAPNEPLFFYDAFLIKYDGAGNLLWSSQIGTTTDDNSFGVAVNAAGNVYITGLTTGSLGGPNVRGSDAFLIKFAVPEPSTFALAALGILGLVAFARRAT